MNTTATTHAPSLAGDLWGGLTAMLVALPSSIAFGVLTYSAMGNEFSGMGALAGLLGAAVLGLIAPMIGRNSALISAPCAPAAAVLSAQVLVMAQGSNGHAALEPQAIVALIALTALAAALLQVFYGVIGGGRLIKFIPYPVVTGYLSGVGVLIALAQLPKLMGLQKGTTLLHGAFSPDLWQWPSFTVGVMTIALMLIAPRITQRLPAAVLGLFGGIGTYFALGVLSPELLTLDNNPLVIGSIKTSGSLLDAISNRAGSLLQINFAALQQIMIPALTLSVLLSIDTLKTCVGMDAMIRTRHHSDRELIAQGCGNLASFFVGGMPGAGTMGPTLVNITSGGRTPRSAMVEGALVILAALLLGPLIAWVPISTLAGIMLVIAWRMFDKGMFRLLRTPAGRTDFVVIASVILVSVTVDLIAAAGTGIAFAILLFIRDQIRGSVIRRKLYLNHTSSKTRRLTSEREVLNAHGDQAVFCELQGNLFFGTTDQLFTQLEPDLRSKRYILLDMRRVQSMDYTAAHLFEQMHAQLAERGGQLLFSGMPSGLIEERNFEHYLLQLGVVREGGGVMIAETLDSALEWMEDRILENAGVTPEDEAQLLSLADFELFEGLDETSLWALGECVTEVTVAPNETVFTHGANGDDMFMVRRGAVRIMLPLDGGKRHHLATIGQGDFFGELSFLDQTPRSADIEAKVRTDLYALSRERFDALCRDKPVVGAKLFARMALAIGVRLRQTDTELRILEER